MTLGRPAAGWVVAVLLGLVPLGLLLNLCLVRTGGLLGYSLDDPYIHMAMAKNMARHGVWGVSPYEFVSASSSPLWTLMLSGVFFTFGVIEWAPLLMAAIASITAVFMAWKLLSRQGWALAGLGSAAVALLVPLNYLSMTGMEHVAHVAATLALVGSVDARIEGKGRAWPLFAWAAAAEGLRLESGFLIVAVVALLALRRDGRGAIAAGAGGAAAVAAISLVGLAHGGLLLPNSVLVKGLLYSAPFKDTLFQSPSLVAVGVATLAFALAGTRGKTDPIMVLAVVSMALYFAFLARFKLDWELRYQGWIVALAIVGLVRAAARAVEHARAGTGNTIALAAGIVLIAISVPLLGLRSSHAMKLVPWASKNIHDQQRQMGRFLRGHYDRQGVVLNDLGETSFLADLKVVDLAGLGSTDLARVKLAGKLDSAAIEGFAKQKDAKIAMIYDGWFYGVLPKSWRRVGTWTISHNVICASSQVAFYAVDEASAQDLERHLRAFSSKLPKDVEVRFERTPTALEPDAPSG